MAKNNSTAPQSSVSRNTAKVENETEETPFVIPYGVFSGLAQYDAKTGAVDVKKTLALFGEHLSNWVEQSEGVKPAIIMLLKKTERIGANMLVPFVMAKLDMSPTTESQEIVKGAIEELINAGQIQRAQDEEGKAARGPAAGFILAKTG